MPSLRSTLALLIKSLYYGIGIISIVLALLYFSSDLNPQSWQPAPPQPLTGIYQHNNTLDALTPVITDAGFGPEDLVLHPNGLIYTAFANGDVIYFDPDAPDIEASVRHINNTNGRPLGLRIDARGNIIIADAVQGLIKMTPTGHVEILAQYYQGKRLQFVDHLDIAVDGKIYFSDASMRFGMHNFVYDFIETSMTGRIFVYDPVSDTLELLVEDLFFANGVALSVDDQFLLINETGKARILRHWLGGARAGETEVFIDQLPAMPDNIYLDETAATGEALFWVGMINLRDPLVEKLAPYPVIRRILGGLPAWIFKPSSEYGMVLAINEQGQVVHNLQTRDAYTSITAALPYKNRLFVGSLRQSHLAVMPLDLDANSHNDLNND